ncbi:MULTISPECIES: ABC transporter substrate-binding protein [Rhizobium/Agrobacterium group]|uniref:ABC transporter substrate binding protein n=2 Tax=Rhizobium/Agrobacterium group TaxID=227290 RepID=B9JX69_ALLAM|nr:MULTISPECIES: ABC transporter substrate-binding protein [Rhizobium/Agrobacterium group]ACM36847.1 ABC transporter substrate binding protein [Allorhizobium ampelinum S4]MUO27234.1 ABC transporter substrate-binding protein [Agrobacterium vitis]MUO43224.1 ABC transporter substrate-binding protein [Agrobacterium vitis]MUP09623.1 ABC transporter substrate-binding protein [Agrobacterium vitis]
MRTLIVSTILAAGLYGMAGSAEAADCGSVSIAEMNWASAGVAANVDKIILESGYGCSVNLVTGDTMPTFTSMNEKGEPDLAPELWVNTIQKPLAEAVKDGRLLKAARILKDGGVEGWWVPKYITDEHPDIKTVQDALKHPELFPAPEDPSKGAVTNCPSGWACQVTTENIYKALKGDDAGFQLVDSGSSAALDGSIANAIEKRQGWLGYYWAPTAILGKYDMVKLGMDTPFDKAEWDRCTSVADCADPRVNDYPVTDVYSVVTKNFAEKAGVTMDYVGKRQWDNETIGKVLAWMSENQADNADAAEYFLKTYPDVWTQWVSPDVAEKVKAAL